MREVTYICRDIGYGVESGVAIGEWTDESDWVGKRAFNATNIFGGDGSVDYDATLYLFDDEIMSDVEAESVDN